jgi:hypothetical protein
MLEIRRLGNQRCAYCDGFGHTVDECPTDLKLRQLRMGVREQAQMVLGLRRNARRRVVKKDGADSGPLVSFTGKKRTSEDACLGDTENLFRNLTLN